MSEQRQGTIDLLRWSQKTLMCRLHDMSSKSKNGYVRLSTVDPDENPSPSPKEGVLNPSQQQPANLRPGLFVMFSKHRRPQALERSESEEIEMTRMKPRRSKHRKPKSPSTKRPKQEIVEEPLLPGDTLQRVSLRYGCPVSRDYHESVEQEKKHCKISW